MAVVIPIHGHPSLAIDAIESALRQQTAFDYRIVLVNDGCRLRETAELCRAYVRGYPRVLYVHRRNGGLSAARNTGVEVALAAWPTIEAVYFLDADNRIGPSVLQRSLDTLVAHPEAGWVYPDIPMFGSTRTYHDMAGPPSLLQLLTMNYSEAGSLVRRSVFERGIRFDEDMRHGFEDWDFWLQCAEAGFQGQHAPDLGYRYRRRAESMLQDSERDRQQIVAYLRRKHRDLFTIRRTIALEHSELPRYALCLTDGPEAVLTTDPTRRQRVISLDEMGRTLARWASRPHAAPFPPLVVVTTQAFLRVLEACGLAESLLWLLEARLAHVQGDLAVACLQCAASTEVRLGIESGDDMDRRWLLARSGMAMMRTGRLHEWINVPERLAAPARIEDATIDVTRVQAAAPYLEHRDLGVPLQRLLEPLEALRRPIRDLRAFDWHQGKAHSRPPADAGQIAWQLHGAGPLFPSVPDDSRIHVGFTVPISDLGGVERVVHNLGREARRRGWVPHLFVIGSGQARMLTEFRNVFATITLVADQALITPERLIGLLGTMDVVINNHCSAVYGVAARLRRLGVKVFAQLHVVDLSPHGVPGGLPYLTLDYEHALDGVVVVSAHLRDWCRAWGIPAEKIFLVPNAPSFEVSDAVVTATMFERARRSPEQPLRALFIGRFDRQKGLDRLAALVRRSDELGIVEWRVVGKTVLGDASVDRNLEALRSCLRPPAVSATELTSLYRWADVLVMVSRYEGTPLTILEAQRLGCVVLSTDVGAVGELVRSGHDGVLFENALPTERLIDRMLDCLQALHGDRSRLRALSEAAAASGRARTWTSAFAPFAGMVEGWFEDRRSALPRDPSDARASVPR